MIIRKTEAAVLPSRLIALFVFCKIDFQKKIVVMPRDLCYNKLSVSGGTPSENRTHN